jgi:hypothetical protein
LIAFYILLRAVTLTMSESSKWSKHRSSTVTTWYQKTVRTNHQNWFNVSSLFFVWFPRNDDVSSSSIGEAIR